MNFPTTGQSTALPAWPQAAARASGMPVTTADDFAFAIDGAMAVQATADSATALIAADPAPNAVPTALSTVIPRTAAPVAPVAPPAVFSLPTRDAPGAIAPRAGATAPLVTPLATPAAARALAASAPPSAAAALDAVRVPDVAMLSARPERLPDHAMQPVVALNPDAEQTTGRARPHALGSPAAPHLPQTAATNATEPPLAAAIIKSTARVIVTAPEVVVRAAPTLAAQIDTAPIAPTHTAARVVAVPTATTPSDAHVSEMPNEAVSAPMAEQTMPDPGETYAKTPKPNAPSVVPTAAAPPRVAATASKTVDPAATSPAIARAVATNTTTIARDAFLRDTPDQWASGPVAEQTVPDRSQTLVKAPRPNVSPAVPMTAAPPRVAGAALTTVDTVATTPAVADAPAERAVSSPTATPAVGDIAIPGNPPAPSAAGDAVPSTVSTAPTPRSGQSADDAPTRPQTQTRQVPRPLEIVAPRSQPAADTLAASPQLDTLVPEPVSTTGAMRVDGPAAEPRADIAVPDQIVAKAASAQSASMTAELPRATAPTPTPRSAPADAPAAKLALVPTPADTPAAKSVLASAPVDGPAVKPVLASTPADEPATKPVPASTPADGPAAKPVPVVTSADVPAAKPVPAPTLADEPAANPVLASTPVDRRETKPALSSAPGEVIAAKPVLASAPADRQAAKPAVPSAAAEGPAALPTLPIAEPTTLPGVLAAQTLPLMRPTAEAGTVMARAPRSQGAMPIAAVPVGYNSRVATAPAVSAIGAATIERAPLLAAVEVDAAADQPNAATPEAPIAAAGQPAPKTSRTKPATLPEQMHEASRAPVAGMPEPVAPLPARTVAGPAFAASPPRATPDQPDAADQPPIPAADTAIPIAPEMIPVAPPLPIVALQKPETAKPSGVRHDAPALALGAVAAQPAHGRDAAPPSRDTVHPATAPDRATFADALPAAPAPPGDGRQTVVPVLPAETPRLPELQPVAARAPAPDATPSPIITAQHGQIGRELGVEIARRVSAGGNELLVRLAPAELGRIEVRMAFDDRGGLTTVIAADSPVALDMLRRDSADLTRSLTDAGFRSDGQSLRFDSGGDRGGGGGQQRSPWSTATAKQDQAGDSASVGDFETPYRPLRTSGRYDLMA